MKQLIIILATGLFSLGELAQPQVQIKKQAQLMADAAAKGNYDKTLAYIYPKVLDSWGGKDEVYKRSKDFKARMQGTGMTINSITVGDPGKIQMIGNRQFCQFYDRISVTANGTPINSGLSVLAISEDKGAKWYFITAGMLTDTKLYQLFPEIKGKISLPLPAMPMMQGKGN